MEDDTSDVVTVTYNLDGMGIEREIEVNGSIDVPGDEGVIAENIEDLEFYYTLEDGSRTTNPADPEDVRAVGVSVIARAAVETEGTGNQNFTSLSGAAWNYHDGFQRQIAKASVKCRNMIDD